jgi:Arc/MetJ-type ribon-helix-helix transcriptional regulator
MAYQIPADLEERVQAHMATGRYASEDEVLRDALDTLDIVETEAQDVQAAIDAVKMGDGFLSLDDAFEGLRKRHHLSRNV